METEGVRLKCRSREPSRKADQWKELHALHLDLDELKDRVDWGHSSDTVGGESCDKTNLNFYVRAVHELQKYSG